MAKVDRTELLADVRRVLTEASTGKGDEPGFLTGFQIFKRLPGPLQDRLEQEYGRTGKHAGNSFGPASRVAQVADEVPNVEKRYLDTRGLQFDVGQQGDVEAGYPLCAIFRLVK